MLACASSSLEHAPEDVYLGTDLGLTKYLIELEEKQRVEKEAQQLVAAVTRAQQLQESRQEQEDIEVSQTDKANQVSIESDLESEEEENVVEPVALERVGESEELPLPQLAMSTEDKELLINQQKFDETLKSVRGWAEKGKRGYGWREGVLVHSQEGESGELLESGRSHR